MSGAENLPKIEDTSSQITELGSNIGKFGEAVGETQLASSSGIPDWLGDSGDSYNDSVLAFREHLHTLKDQFSPVKEALTEYADAIGPANAKIVEQQEAWDEAEDTYRKEIRDLNEMADRIEQEMYDSLHRSHTETRDKAHEDCRTEYKRIIKELDDLAGEKANDIQATLDAYISPEIVEGGRSAIGADLFNDIPVVDGQAEWDYQSTQAQDAIDLLNTQDPPTPELIAEFMEKYGENMSNPFFANAISEQLPPNKVLELQGYMELYLSSGSMNETDTKTLNEFTQSLGEMMVLATGGSNASDPQSMQAWEAVKEGLRGDNGLTVIKNQQDYRNDFIDAGNSYYEMYDMGPVNPEDAINYPLQNSTKGGWGYPALMNLLGAAAQGNPGLTVGDGFLNGPYSVGNDILEWDAQWGKSAVGYPGWPSQDHVEYGLFGKNSGINSSFDPVYGLIQLMDGTEVPTDSEYTQFLVDQDHARLDAAREFLAKERDLPNVGEPMSTSRYLTGHRAVGDVGVPIWPDLGYTLGGLLEEASAPGVEPPVERPADNAPQAEWDAYNTWIERNKNAAIVAGGYLEGYQDALDEQGLYQNLPHYGNMNPGLRASAGNILAPWVEGMALSLDTPNTTEDGVTVTADVIDGHPAEYSIAFDADFARRLTESDTSMFVDLAMQPVEVDDGKPVDSLSVLVQATQIGYSDSLTTSLSGTEDSRADQMLQDNNVWGNLYHELTVAPAEMNTAIKEEVQSRNDFYKGLAEDGISLLPAGKFIGDNPVVNYLYDSTIGAATGVVTDAVLPDPDSVNGGREEENPTSLMGETFRETVWENQVWPEGYDPRANLGDDFYNTDGSAKPYTELTDAQRNQLLRELQNDPALRDGYGQVQSDIGK